MKRHAYLWLAPIAVLTLVGFGCSKKKVSVKTAAGNVNATVDVGTNSATINVNGTTMNTGESVKLPSDFPNDVYVIDGTVKTAISTPNVGQTVSLTTSKTMAEAQALYEQKMKDNGWMIASSGVVNGNTAAIIATKDNRTATIGISEVEKPTAVTLSVMQNSGTNSNDSAE